MKSINLLVALFFGTLAAATPVVPIPDGSKPNRPCCCCNPQIEAIVCDPVPPPVCTCIAVACPPGAPTITASIVKHTFTDTIVRPTTITLPVPTSACGPEPTLITYDISTLTVTGGDVPPFTGV